MVYLQDWEKRHDARAVNTYFRGHADRTWKLVPSICRDTSEKAHETDIIEKQMRAGNWNLRRPLFENIAHLQHYGVHSRFLDFTTDLDVALFFACNQENMRGVDGEVLVCHYGPRRIDSIDTLLITEMALLKESVLVSVFVDMIMSKYSLLTYTHYPDVDSVRKSLGLSVLSWIDHGFMVHPSKEEYEHMKTWNARIGIQSGTFFIPGNKAVPPDPRPMTTNMKSTIIFPEIVDIPTTIMHHIKRFLVKKEDKGRILDELAEVRGISRSILLPDE